MIDQWNDDRTGFAQFSDDEVMRYHLIYLVSDRSRELGGDIVITSLLGNARPRHALRVATWLLLNPSTATAFRPDPTVGECVKFTRRWWHDVTWIVNPFAFRSPYPSDLKKRAVGERGDDAVNAAAILIACSQADIVIAGWGVGGDLDSRDVQVRKMLASANVRLHHLGLTKDGFPKHPLARGVHRIPTDQQPIHWCTP